MILFFFTVVSVDFDPPSYTVLEGGVVMVQLLLAGSSRIPITVSLSTVDGTATGEGVRSVSKVLSWCLLEGEPFCLCLLHSNDL